MRRALLVGVGGIGSFIVTNHQNNCHRDTDIRLSVVDHDTIQLSNLGRQLYYRKEDIGLPKVDVLSSRVECLDNVFNLRVQDLSLEVLRSFNIIICTADNLSTRRYCNQLSLSLGITLIDAGSEGWLGHIRYIIPGITPCLECDISLYSNTHIPLCHVPKVPLSTSQAIGKLTIQLSYWHHTTVQSLVNKGSATLPDLEIAHSLATSLEFEPDIHTVMETAIGICIKFDLEKPTESEVESITDRSVYTLAFVNRAVAVFAYLGILEDATTSSTKGSLINLNLRGGLSMLRTYLERNRDCIMCSSII